MIKLTLISFGHKYATPEADAVYDVRDLPNPFWEDALKDLTGLDTQVCHFFEDRHETHEKINELNNIISILIDSFEPKNTSEFNIAIGCTGGQHRSVYVVEKLAKILENRYPCIRIEHKEQTKW